MPIASPEVYAEMIDRAKAGGFAYPAINVTSSSTVNAALRGFAEAESDGILQVWGGPVSPGMSGPESEVAQIHVIPLADFDVPPRLLRIPESEAPVIQLPLLGRYVHAPTAAIIYQFCQAGLHGNMIRVAHFEQPVFAWK